MTLASIVNRSLGWLAGAIVTLCLLYALACFALYAIGARHSPTWIPASTYRAPERIRLQYLSVEAKGATQLHKSSPLTFWPELYQEIRRSPEKPDSGKVLTYNAARVVGMRYSSRGSMGAHHLSQIALSIKIGRQWTVDQAVNTLLAESDFGKGVVGIEAAAHHYYGVPAMQLRPQESLALIALMKGPSWYDPYCNPERFADRYIRLATQLGHSGTDWDISFARSRMRPATCRNH